MIARRVGAPDVAEQGAAPVADRLRAAASLKSRGWRIRIRIEGTEQLAVSS